MRDITVQLNGSDRPSATVYKGASAESSAGACSATATLLRREALMRAIRLSRVLGTAEITTAAEVEGRALVDLPRCAVSGTDVHDFELSHQTGLFAPGSHLVSLRTRVGNLDIEGTFEVAVDRSIGHAAQWTATNRATGRTVEVPGAIVAQLPTSIAAPSVSGGALLGAIRRAHLAAERGRRELIETNRGLIRSVVNRYRGVVRSESSALDMSDLLIVGEHQLLHVVDRHFTDPQSAPVRDVAWSKLVQRAVGNAVRSEIARATGVSVEFRQLLTWFQTHPEDRDEQSAVVAQRMAFAAGVTRLMGQRDLHDRFAGVAALELMLVSGQARYVAPGRDAAETARRLRQEGVFVISSRSSLAEIERAQQFSTAGHVRLDADPDSNDRSTHLAASDEGYDAADWTDMVRRIIEDSGMTKVEALVWLHRTGALDPGGFGTELPEIADDLGLSGRSEARAALRRARRKLDAWAGDGAPLALVS